MSGLTYDICLVYLDDILVFSRTFDELLKRLATVLDRLDRYSLKLKPSKCSLFQHKVSFLGHVVSGRGIECDPEKLVTITTWPTPTNISEVRTARARPLHNLTKKGDVFKWTPTVRLRFST